MYPFLIICLVLNSSNLRSYSIPLKPKLPSKLRFLATNSEMPVSLPRLAIGLILLVVTVLAIVGVATKQFDVEVAPSPLLPTARCQVELYFFHRKTICPAPLPSSTVRTPRDEGFFDCVSAWDTFQTGFAFTILGIIFAGLSFMLYIGSAFVPAGARVFSLWVLAGMATASAVFLLIAWALVESLANGFCGHDFEGYRTTGFALVIDPKKEYGHSLIISAWCISVVGAVAALAHAIWVRKHPEAAPAKQPATSPDALPVTTEPAAEQKVTVV